MEASFVRIQGSPDRFYVHRTDGSEVSWTFPTYGSGLPHDLIHLVVEAAFGLRDGFWGRVDAGADPARVNAMANRMGGKEKFAALGPDGTDLELAEALANAPWANAVNSDEQRREAISEGCSELGLDLPASVTVETIASVRETLDRLRGQWAALVPKGTIRLSFDRNAPEASFRSM